LPGFTGARAIDAGDVVEGEDEVWVRLAVGIPEFREILDEALSEDGAAVEPVESGILGDPLNRCRWRFQ
jgi:hypothetical protein